MGKSGIAVKLYRFSVLAAQLLVEGWIHIIYVFLIHPVFGKAQALTEAYKMELAALRCAIRS